MASKVKHLQKYSLWLKKDAAACDCFRDNPDFLTKVLSEVTCKKCLHVIERDHLVAAPKTEVAQMISGEGKVSLQKNSEVRNIFGLVQTKAAKDTCKSVTQLTVGTNPLTPIYVKYKDHVFFKNISEPPAAAVIRETIGWVKEENDELFLIETDRAVPRTGKNVNGIIILKNCIIEAYPLPLQNNSECRLNSQNSTIKSVECAFRPSERKTHGAKDSRRKSQTC